MNEWMSEIMDKRKDPLLETTSIVKVLLYDQENNSNESAVANKKLKMKGLP